MYIDFILTRDEPQIDTIARRVFPGELSDGFFVLDLPGRFAVGGLIQISFERDEHGSFEVEVYAEELGSGESRVVRNWLIDVPPTDDEWEIPRVHTRGFIAEFNVEDEAEFALAVYIDRRFVGERCLKVCSAQV